MKRPAFQFYPADWRKDVELRSCSLAARGLWIDMLCIAHECDPYGHLVLNGKPMTAIKIAGQIGGITGPQVQRLIDELIENGVARIKEDGTLYSKRMVEDERLREIRAEAGKLGGNPALLGKKVNQPDNNQPKQKPTPSSSSSSSSSEEPNGSERARKRAARQCPQPFVVTAEMRAWAALEVPSVSLEQETDKFLDHTFKTAISDWPSAWRNWMRRALEFGSRMNGSKQSALESRNAATVKRLLEDHATQ
jgi:hypothetical protein